MSTVTFSTLKSELGVGNETLKKSLEAMNIKPVSEFKFGRGIMRCYDRTQINTPELAKTIEKVKAQTAVTQAEQFKKIKFPHDRLPSVAIHRVETKLDMIMSALGLKYNGNGTDH